LRAFAHGCLHNFSPTKQSRDAKRSWHRLDASLGNCLAQIAKREQCQAENGTPEIKVMTNALLKAPMHLGQEVKRLGDMSEHNHQTSCAKELQERARCLFFGEQNDGARGWTKG
jgi:hypothetical protein